MSDTKLDDETELAIRNFGEACQEYEAANGSTTSPEYIEAVQGAESTLAALRDRVRELVTDAYSRGTYDTQMRYAGTD